MQVRVVELCERAHHGVVAAISRRQRRRAEGQRRRAEVDEWCVGQIELFELNGCRADGGSTWPNVNDWSGRSCNETGRRDSQPPSMGIADNGRLLIAGTRLNAAT